MYEVATREVPERSLLCLKRNVDPPGAWALGKKFVAILRERSLPKLGGREGAMFSIYWSEVSADSDGPVEWCRPVPEKDASALALLCPELNLRTEPAHREAYVALPDGAVMKVECRSNSRLRRCALGRKSTVLVQGVFPSLLRSSECGLPTSQASRAPRRTLPTATSQYLSFRPSRCRQPDADSSATCTGDLNPARSRPVFRGP